MSLLFRLRNILAKIEPNYGEDSTPTGSANAILCSEMDIEPIAGGTVPRNLIRSYLGNSEQLPTAVYARMTMTVEIAGSGTAGTAAAWGPLLRACGYAETLLAAAEDDTATAGGADTITLAAGESATDDAYVGMKITLDGGTGSGQERTIINYVGSTKVATVDTDWTTQPDATSTYVIAAQAAYAPVSDSFESVTMYMNVNGVKHAMLGARGNVTVAINNNQIPVFRFDMTGIYVAVADASAPTTVLTAWQQPLVVNQTNTPSFELHGYAAGALESVEFNSGNDVQFRSLPGGSEQVLIVDRQASGSVQFEATTVATKDWWANVRAATLGSMMVEHGTAAGNTVRITAPYTQLITPRYQESQGIAMFNASTAYLPVNGNDELLITAL